MTAMVAKIVAVYEPAKQTRAALLYWRLPKEWADVLHPWVSSKFLWCQLNFCRMQATVTGQLNTILTFYEISDPPIPSPLCGIPMPLLRRAITILTRFNRAQTITARV
jgi:ESCRT-II complex subunit VPS25